MKASILSYFHMFLICVSSITLNLPEREGLGKIKEETNRARQLSWVGSNLDLDFCYRSWVCVQYENISHTSGSERSCYQLQLIGL